ncbi:hypothetical protein RN607_01905 [Demequina capsici]|uniref:LPXTG-motif cell wall anchor domain-containing protein n=1 Tax=Demequina capsici TaxID=3075620 RepID=A0AA96FDW0_9MICO|nr:hypothetical protein [Demequina sp. PMTSA13]WNM27784.1 hypothetical protein RN607_01905 [Demequina sp. PMTSA13]
MGSSNPTSSFIGMRRSRRMMPRRRRGPAAATITALLAATVGVGAVAAPAAAAYPVTPVNSLVPSTSFELDGNTGADKGGVDWATLAAAGGAPVVDSSGVYNGYTYHPDTCPNPDGVTDDIGDPQGGTKLADGPIWPSIDSKVGPEKSDLASVAVATQKVQNTVTGGVDDIVYANYERCSDTSGSMIATLFINNGDNLVPSTGGDGDFLLVFDFNPAGNKGPTAEFLQYDKANHEWSDIGTVPAGIVDMAPGQTFSEAGVNLTSLQAWLTKQTHGTAGQCYSLDVGGQAATVSGYSKGSRIWDLVKGDTLPVSNCADIKVTKTANVTDTTTQFGYEISRAGGGNVYPGQATQDGTLTVGQSTTWTDVVSGIDYLVNETGSLDPGWTLDTVMCTYSDIFTSGAPDKTVTLYDRSKGGVQAGAQALVTSNVPGVSVKTTECTIHNSFSGIEIVKAGSGDPNAEFGFTIGDDPYTFKLGDAVTIPSTVGEPVTISEDTVPSDGLPWNLTSLQCVGPDGKTATGDVNLRAGTVTVTPAGEGLIVCTFTNVQKGQLVVEKATQGGTGTFVFGGTIAGLVQDPSLTTTKSDGTASGGTLSGLVDGAASGFSVSEEPQAGWRLDQIACTDDQGNPVSGSPGDFGIAAGQTVTCLATNTKLGQITLTKHVSGVASGYPWSFDFALAADGYGPDTQSLSGTGDVSDASKQLMWKDLTPGKTYTLSETGADGFDVTWMCYDGNTALSDADANTAGYQVDVVAGSDITCTVTNTAQKSNLTVTKTVTGVAGDMGWSFDFTLTPNGGAGVTKTASGTGDVSKDLTWSDLLPGGVYTITEQADGDYTQSLACYYDGDHDTPVTDLVLDDLGVTFEAGFDENIVCEADNAAKPADLTLNKSVSGIAAGQAWSFTFTLDPAADGVGAQTETGSGPTSFQLTWSKLVPGQTYTISESAATGYTQNLSCDGATDISLSTTTVRFVADFDQHITCTATNVGQASTLELTKEVRGVSGGSDWSFDFTLAPSAGGGGVQTLSGTGNSSDVKTWTNLVPGTQYVLSEAVDDNYVQHVSCTGVTDLDKVDTSVTFVAGFGQSITCSATNEAKPTTVSLTKQVDGVAADFPWSFTFGLLTDDGNGAVQRTISGMGGVESDPVEWTNLIPGTVYTLMETAVPGYTTDIVCTGVDDSDPAGDAVVFTAGYNQQISCTATNTAIPSTLDLTKTVVGVATGFDWSFDFTVSPDPDGSSTHTITGAGSGTSAATSWTMLTPGQTYVVAETPVPGYTTDLQCTGVTDTDEVDSTVTFVAGLDQSITCAATNTAIASTLDLTKTVVGVATGFDWSFDFTVSPDPDESGTQTITGSGSTTSAPILWSHLVPGMEYTVSETPVAGYTTDLQCTGVTDTDEVDSTVTFVAGLDQSITCAATNTAIASTLDLSKTVEGVADGFDWSFDFVVTPDPDDSATHTLSGAGSTTEGPTMWSMLIPGQTYTVAETPVAGYTTDLQCTGVEDSNAADNAVTFVAGLDQSITCAATNTAMPADLTLTKTVSGVMDDYGWSFGFTLDPAATGGGTQTASGVGNSSATLTWSDLVPGETYTMTEDASSDFAQSLICAGVGNLDGSAATVTFVAGLGEHLTCEATNVAESSSLSLQKTVVGVDDGVEWSFDFSLSPDAMPLGTQTVAGAGSMTADPIEWTGLVPGQTYTVSETAVDGYNTAMVCDGVEDQDGVLDNGSVTFTAGFGEQIVCRVVNVKEQDTQVEGEGSASVSVTKTVVGVPDGTPWSFTFALSPDALPVGTQTVTGTGSSTADPIKWTQLVPGETYTVSEVAVTGYSTIMVCDGVTDLDTADNTVTFIPVDKQQVACKVVNVATVKTQVLSEGPLASTGADIWWPLALGALFASGGVTALAIRRRYL